MAEVINLKPMKYKDYEITFARVDDGVEYRIIALVRTRLTGIGEDMGDAIDKAHKMIDRLKK